MTTGFFGGRDLKSHFFQAKSATFVGLTQAGSNSIVLPPGSQVGDLALFYGCENTSATASGTQAIAAGPTGWTSLSGAGVAQVSTTPTFTTRGVWWKKLVAADLDVAAGQGGTGNGVVSFTVGTLGIASACGVLVFRGGTSFSLRSSGGTSGVTISRAIPVAVTGAKVYICLLCLRADLNEVITPAQATWVNVYPGAMFAGAFFFRDPSQWVGGEIDQFSWTTSSQGFQHFIAIL